MAVTQPGLSVKIAPAYDAAIGELPAPLRERLAAEGVFTLADWVALGRRRRQLFGITSATVKKLDTLARSADR